MELRQLEYFVAVAEEASFTRAAERVHVAQPGVSAQIQKLEREFGQALFDRSGRTVKLTEAGLTVLPFARAALAAVEDAQLAVDELTGLLRGRVAVGMITSCGALDLPQLLAEFHGQFPGVEIMLAEDNSDRLIAELLAGRLDLALIGYAGEPDGVEVQLILDEELVVATTEEFHGLREHGLISLPQGTGMRSALDNACAAMGFAPRIAFEASDPTMLAELARRGLGPAVLPVSLAEAHADRLTAHRIGLRSCLGWAWRAEGPRSPAARALIAKISGRH